MPFQLSATRRMLGALLSLSAVTAAANYNESVDGDLSSDRFNPTHIALDVGTNLISGFIGSPDNDYFVVTVPPETRLEAIILREYNNPANTTFFGMHQQAYYEPTLNPLTFGYTSFGVPQVGSDLLPDMGLSNGNFLPPLPEGEYTFRLNEIHGVEAYALEFVIAATACDADLNADGTVNLADLSILLANYGVDEGATFANGDLNGDGTINLDDLSQLLAAYATTCD